MSNQPKMRAYLIPNGVRHLPQADGLRLLPRVIKAPWFKSLALLGMIASVIWLALPKPPLLEGISFSQRVRDRSGKLLRVTLTADQKYRIRTSLIEISPQLV